MLWQTQSAYLGAAIPLARVGEEDDEADFPPALPFSPPPPRDRKRLTHPDWKLRPISSCSFLAPPYAVHSPAIGG